MAEPPCGGFDESVESKEVRKTSAPLPKGLIRGTRHTAIQDRVQGGWGSQLMRRRGRGHRAVCSSRAPGDPISWGREVSPFWLSPHTFITKEPGSPKGTGLCPLPPPSGDPDHRSCLSPSQQAAGGPLACGGGGLKSLETGFLLHPLFSTESRCYFNLQHANRPFNF